MYADDIYREDIVFRDPRNTFAGLDRYKLIFKTVRVFGRIFFRPRSLQLEILRIWQVDALGRDAALSTRAEFIRAGQLLQSHGGSEGVTCMPPVASSQRTAERRKRAARGFVVVTTADGAQDRHSLANTR